MKVKFSILCILLSASFISAIAQDQDKLMEDYQVAMAAAGGNDFVSYIKARNRVIKFRDTYTNSGSAEYHTLNYMISSIYVSNDDYEKAYPLMIEAYEYFKQFKNKKSKKCAATVAGLLSDYYGNFILDYEKAYVYTKEACSYSGNEISHILELCSLSKYAALSGKPKESLKAASAAKKKLGSCNRTIATEQDWNILTWRVDYTLLEAYNSNAISEASKQNYKSVEQDLKHIIDIVESRSDQTFYGAEETVINILDYYCSHNQISKADNLVDDYIKALEDYSDRDLSSVTDDNTYRWLNNLAAAASNIGMDNCASYLFDRSYRYAKEHDVSPDCLKNAIECNRQYYWNQGNVEKVFSMTKEHIEIVARDFPDSLSSAYNIGFNLCGYSLRHIRYFYREPQGNPSQGNYAPIFTKVEDEKVFDYWAWMIDNAKIHLGENSLDKVIDKFDLGKSNRVFPIMSSFDLELMKLHRLVYDGDYSKALVDLDELIEKTGIDSYQQESILWNIDENLYKHSSPLEAYEFLDAVKKHYTSDETVRSWVENYSDNLKHWDWGQHNFSESLFMKGDIDGAIYVCDDILKTKERLAQVDTMLVIDYNFKGQLLNIQERYEEAIPVLIKADSLSRILFPDYLKCRSLILSNLEKSYEKCGNESKKYEVLKQHLDILYRYKNKYPSSEQVGSDLHWCWNEQASCVLLDLTEIEYDRGNYVLAESHYCMAAEISLNADSNCTNIPKESLHNLIIEIHQKNCLKYIESEPNKGLEYFKKTLQVALDNPDEGLLISAHNLDLLATVLKSCAFVNTQDAISLAYQVAQIIVDRMMRDDRLRLDGCSVNESIASEYSSLGWIFWKEIGNTEAAEYFYSKAVSYLEVKGEKGGRYEEQLGFLSAFYQQEFSNQIMAVELEYRIYKNVCERLGKESEESYKAFSRLFNCSYRTRYYLNSSTRAYSDLNMSLRSCRQWRQIVREIQSVYGAEYLNSLLDYDQETKVAQYGANSNYTAPVIRDGSIGDTYLSEPEIFLLEDKRDSAAVSVINAMQYFEKNEPELWYEATEEIMQTLSRFGWYDMKERMLRLILDKAYKKGDYNRLDKAWSELAALKYEMGDTEMARTMASIDDMDMFLSYNLTSYVQNMNTLGKVSTRDSDYSSAIEYFNRALSVLDGVLPNKYTEPSDKIRFCTLPSADTSYTEIILLNLSDCYLRMEDYDTAAEVLQKGIQIRFKGSVPKCDDASFPSGLMQELAILKYKQRKYDQAISIFEDCLKFQKRFGWSTTATESWLSGCFSESGDAFGFEEHSRAFLTENIKDYMRQSAGMNETSRDLLWDSSGSSYMIDAMGHFYCEGIGRSSIGAYYDLALNYKGFLLVYSSFIEDNIKSSSDEILKDAYNRYKDAVASGDSLRVARESECMYLYSLHSEFFTYTPQKWQEVQESLGKRDVAIEFVRCFGNSKENNTYNALLLTKKRPPVLIELCKESLLEDVAKKFQEAASSDIESLYNHLYKECNDALYINIWKKLLPYLKNANRVYFSPHGILSQLNIEIVTTPTGKDLSDSFEIRRVSTTASLAGSEFSAISSYYGTVLYGGLVYDTIETAGSIVNDQISTMAINDENRGKLDLSHPLGGTKWEVETIDKLLSNSGVTDVMYTGTEGTEDTFKALSTVTAPIIHIATHGFYFDNEEASRQDYYSSMFMINGADAATYVPPMKRAGLILSGARNAWEHGSITGDSDNILFAEEIAGVDLSKTDLLVLSACQTGLGEILGDGVYGLQRAFKLAGVGTIIMSLWNVDDNATQLMMTTFYDKLLNGMTKRDSFNYAIAKVKGRYPSQKYWGAFIMLD